MSVHTAFQALHRLKNWCLFGTACFGREVTRHGVAYFPYRGEPETAFVRTIEAPDALLVQLQRLRRQGLCTFTNKKFEFAWDAVYQIAHGPDRVLAGLLHLDTVAPVRLAVHSRGGAGTPCFTLAIDKPSRPKSGESWLLEKQGVLLPFSSTGHVLSLENFQLMKEVYDFNRRPRGARITPEADAAWKSLVQRAQTARAEVGKCVTKRVTLDIESLRLMLKLNDVPGKGEVIELVPYFTGAPSAWRDVFLEEKGATNQYLVPSPAGLVQVEVAECVMPILYEAKRLQGRPLRGQESLYRILRQIDITDVEDMSPAAFEFLCALIYRKSGYPRSFRVGGAGDGGVDVVSLRGETGLLLQCKSSKELDKRLGWEGVKDVVAGEAAYRLQYPSVQFEKIALTNQFFNDTARTQANINNVLVMDKNDIMREVQKFHISYLELRHFSRGAV